MQIVIKFSSFINFTMDLSSLQNSAIIVSILTLTSPIELVKIRLQTTHELLTSGKIGENYKSIRHCISTITQKEGIKSLWKGNAIGILRFFPNQSINFQTRATLQKYVPGKFSYNVMVAIVAGWTASSLLYPFDILRMSLSNSTEKEYKISQTFKNIVRTHGVKYFYKGYLNSMVGTAVFRGSFNGFYDSSKGKAKSIELKALIAYTCAVIAGGICYPLDSIRRRRIMINSNDSLASFAKKVWSKEGVKGFYKGSKLILPQSLTGAVILMLFDTTGIPIFGQQI